MPTQTQATNIVNRSKIAFINLEKELLKAQQYAMSITQEISAHGAASDITSEIPDAVDHENPESGDWEERFPTMTKQQWHDAMANMASAQDLLGALKTNLYRLKD